MLEAINLCKIYKPKKGIPVTALDGVSIKFPEKGMVFLLGKSGSGKSTLLHLLGGLDRYDCGEIIIKGVSSKSFRQKHFDSYRNTYVGFIFQDYNVLDEFSVGANIALAIELQGRKATDEDINKILHEVDLDGYGTRKPNELSGGQKQRVAIARALVKNPQIIMADEPTGALDSNTGKQVLDTLKKLSKDKLVIVVSHDRDFAERYADRIIELADGKVISDIEYESDVEAASEENIVYNGDTIEISGKYHLTEEDRVAINEYIDSLKGDNIKLKILGAGKSLRKSSPTDVSKIKYSDSSAFKLIKSRLPLKSAFKIGASGLKHKKIRLVITILLSCVAFGLFGLSDTIAAYNHIETCTTSIIDSKIDYVSLSKAIKKEYNGGGTYYDSYGYTLKQEELDKIYEETGVLVDGVYTPFNTVLDFDAHYNTDYEFSKTEFHIYAYGFNGFAELTQNKMDAMGYKLIGGRMPDGSKNEIGITEYIAQTFILGGYSDGTLYENKKGELEKKYTAITKSTDLIGKKLKINGTEYTVTCIIDTGFDISRYVKLTEEEEGESTADQLVDYALYSEISFIRDYGNVQVAYVGEGFVDNLVKNDPTVKRTTNGFVSYSCETGEEWFDLYPDYVGGLNDVKQDSIVWINKNQDKIGNRELVVSLDILVNNGLATEYEDENGKVTVSLQLDNKKFKKYGYIEGTDDSHEIPGYNEEYTVVGYIDTTKYPSFGNIILGSDGEFKDLYIMDNGPYSYCIGKMPETEEEIRGLVSYCYREDADVRYQLNNSVTYELDVMNEALQEISKVFLYVGIGFALFAALMLANFISTSISYKKQEIGILRAIGSRSRDVFSIFFAESFIIAMINFILSTVGVFAVTEIINIIIRREVGLLVTMLTFSPRQIILLFGISIAIAAIASFIPVKRIASKKPIDAIRNR